jgi:hypothetical protein
MKYLILLLFVSCATNPNCTVKEAGSILSHHYTILECQRPMERYTNDADDTNRMCLTMKNENGTYTCFTRD